MRLYCKEKQYTLYEGKMQEVLATLPDNSIDSIVCDPPYDLTTMTKRFGKENAKECKKGNDGSFQRLRKGFMGKTWDGTGVAFDPETWKHCLRVLKDGGYLLAFGGSRTFHRMAVAIEDAGFEIRDTIMWLYGSGFPKSHNVGLDIDKLNGCSDRGHRIATASRNHPDGTFEPNGDNLPKYEGRTEEGKEWEGWGTALKPAFEPIIMARKPMKCSVAQNVLKNGVGAINIDECRVFGEEIETHNAPKGTFAGKTQTIPKFKRYNGDSRLSFGQYKDKAERIEYKQHEGRFPANVITDGSEEVASGMPDTKSVGGCSMKESMFGLSQKQEDFNYNDEGSAMRYFYQAKASKKDRDEGLDMFDSKNMRLEQNRQIHSKGCEYEENGRIKQNPHLQSSIKKNFHPTVKPIELMQYLVKLVSPKGSVVLDCFMGSGSTGKATMFENRERNANYHFIGIEMTPEYLPIAQARIEYAINKYEYDMIKDAKDEKERTGQQSIFDF